MGEHSQPHSLRLASLRAPTPTASVPSADVQFCLKQLNASPREIISCLYSSHSSYLMQALGNKIFPYSLPMGAQQTLGSKQFPFPLMDVLRKFFQVSITAFGWMLKNWSSDFFHFRKWVFIGQASLHLWQLMWKYIITTIIISHFGV